MRDKREVINVKRILSLVLSLCLVMTMMPAAYAGGTAYGAEKLEAQPAEVQKDVPVCMIMDSVRIAADISQPY